MGGCLRYSASGAKRVDAVYATSPCRALCLLDAESRGVHQQIFFLHPSGSERSERTWFSRAGERFADVVSVVRSERIDFELSPLYRSAECGSITEDKCKGAAELV